MDSNQDIQVLGFKISSLRYTRNQLWIDCFETSIFSKIKAAKQSASGYQQYPNQIKTNSSKSRASWIMI